VGPRVGLDAVEKRIMFHCRESNPGRPARRCPTPLPSYCMPYKVVTEYVASSDNACSWPVRISVRPPNVLTEDVRGVPPPQANVGTLIILPFDGI
jgi:hypothetical protein